MERMAKVVCLADYRQPRRTVCFDRMELNRLLALYSRRVSRGEWRDYAIDQGAGMAVFSVFRHADDRPLFAVAKIAEGPGQAGGYVLFRGSRILKKARSLDAILSLFSERLKLVVSRT